jgi:hypothetical protein
VCGSESIYVFTIGDFAHFFAVLLTRIGEFTLRAVTAFTYSKDRNIDLVS